MMQPFNALIVDDHPLIVKAYQSALRHYGKKHTNINLHVDTATNCDEAYAKIKEAKLGRGLDLIFLDISLPPSEDGKIISGEDLGVIVRNLLPQTKIAVSTTYTRNIRLNSILKSIDPDGFLIKNDLTPEVLTEAIESIVTEPPYYCKTVIKFLRKKATTDYILDRTDRSILFQLSKGTKMKELPNILNLSIAAIERRKRILKEEFNVEGGSDRELLQAAEEAGFI